MLGHRKENHGIRSDNSPTFDSYVVAISIDSNHSTQMFVEFCEFSKSPPFFDLKKKAEHYLQKHLKLLRATRNDILIRKIGDKFIELSIDYRRHMNLYDFKNPDKVIYDFIENVSRHINEAESEFRLICCIINQTATETHGRKLYMNDCFTTGITEGSMITRVKEFLFENTKKRVLINGENESNVYFYRFKFLKIYFMTSNLIKYINLLGN